jgi:hypothetical protein
VQNNLPPGAGAALAAGQPRLGSDFAFPSPESVYLSTNPAAPYDQQRAAPEAPVSPPVCFTTTVRSSQQQQQREAMSHANYLPEQQQAAHLPAMDSAAHVPSEQQPAAVSLNGNINGNLNGQTQHHGANAQFESPFNYPGASLGPPLNYPEAPASTVYTNVTDLLHILEQQMLTEEDVSSGNLNAPTDLGAGEGEELNACMICLDSMQAGQWATKLPCGHSFHTGCVVEWLGHRINGKLPGCCPSCNYLVLRTHSSIYIYNPWSAVRAATTW